LPVPGDFELLEKAVHDRYRLQRELGRGGMATVYLAHDLKHDRQVAIKVLRADLTAALGPERFLREITLTARLEHPHILPLLDSGDADGLLFYVMPYVEGESLRDRLTREKQLPVADALSYAHRQGILHRDIKPENILLAAGHARVADFGIARAVTTAGGSSLTETGLALGTPLYMSPEQATAERELDGRTDIYSLACVVYEMLAGQPPYTGATPAAILARKSLEAVPSIRVVRDAVPLTVEQAIAKALAKVPADRFANASEFAEALREGGAHKQGPESLVSAVRHSLTAVGSRALWRHRVLIAGVAFVAALVAIVFRPRTASHDAVMQAGDEAIKSIAVLPLENLSHDPEQDYFAEGMTAELITNLGKVSTLRVISHTSMMRYKGTQKSLSEIARELDVDGIVEGTVQRTADRVRITANLLRAPSERQLWGETYDRGLSDVLAVQSEIVSAIAAHVRAVVTPEQRARLAANHIVNAEAYEAWIRGRVQMATWAKPDLSKADADFRRAIAIDSNYAPPYAALARLDMIVGHAAIVAPEKVFPEEKRLAEKALQLDSTLAQAWIARADAEFLYERDWPRAQRDYAQGLALNPNDPYGHDSYSGFLLAIGKTDEGIEENKRALDLDPASVEQNAYLAFTLFYARRYDEAIRQARLTLELDSTEALSRLALGLSYEQRRDFHRAYKEVQTAVNRMQHLPFTAFLGHIAGASGRRADALKVVDNLKVLSKRMYVSPSVFAIAYLGAGDKDVALGWLEKAYDTRDHDLVFVNCWPMFDPLHSEPRFQALLRRMQFPPASPPLGSLSATAKSRGT
jgi:serine/threonine-protein kinase